MPFANHREVVLWFFFNVPRYNFITAVGNTTIATTHQPPWTMACLAEGKLLACNFHNLRPPEAKLVEWISAQAFGVSGEESSNPQLRS